MRPFTPNAKKVLELALRESMAFGQRRMGTEHVLLGIAGASEGVGARVLRMGGFDGYALRERIVLAMTTGSTSSEGRSLESRGFEESSSATDHANLALRCAEDEARAMGHGTVGTEHLLLGLCLDSRGLAGRVLIDADVTIEQVRNLVRERLGAARATRRKRRLPFSTEAESALALASQTARELREPLGTQHILVGIVARTGTGAYHILRALDVDPEEIGFKVKRLAWPLYDREAGPSLRVMVEPVHTKLY